MKFEFVTQEKLTRKKNLQDIKPIKQGDKNPSTVESSRCHTHKL